MRDQARKWAREEFAGAELGDERRTNRLVTMAMQAAVKPGGHVSEVFASAAERQGAYDFLEGDAIRAEPMSASMGRACATRSAEFPFVFAPIDGSSLTLTDRQRCKDFGVIGSYKQGGRGLKVIDAIAVSPAGVPLGISALRWWSRSPTRPQRRHAWSASRKVHEKETQHWLDAIDQVGASFRDDAPSTRLWFQLDREGDAWPVLHHLSASGQLFTVRSRSNRRLRTDTKQRRYLRDALRRQLPLGDELLEVPAGHGRRARLACMTMRAATVTLAMHDAWTTSNCPMTVNAVWVRETSAAPRGESPLEWILLTNHAVETLDDVKLVVFGYTQRWRIEDFHKTWKSGVCNVESTQLHAKAHVIKWATLLAAVAMRVERLKHLARQQPTLPASTELSPVEVEALILLKRKYKKRTEEISDAMPSIEQATLWIAELGGYTGKSSGGPPGSITIGRGLEHLLIAAEVIEALRSSKKKR
jgi:hypothetical protein